ncbi:hypothetical protein DPMN_117197 [Dreissena polymorpha]|uniref:Uncharacterized protein n=1 Tax=Dreissena polymorpha TaxID=45954 RepID=A0A9D4KQ19_DREPO|nr:hypothetical protein DPMN_117197 [Dreissena polymorpha]
MVWPTISYGAAILGIQEFTCINAVHYKACRFFLGVGRYTPTQQSQETWDGHHRTFDSGNQC